MPSSCRNSCANDFGESAQLEPIPKYGRHHGPIVRLLMFWLNGLSSERLTVAHYEKEIRQMTSTATAPIPTAVATSTWNIDPAHSAAEFKVRHMMISFVKGKFSGLSGVLKLDESDYTHSSVEVSIPAASVSTVDEKLNAHLKESDFFDVEQFPSLTFKSKGIRWTGGRDYVVDGELTIRGITKPVTLSVTDVSEPAKDPWGNLRIGLSGSTKVDRREFGLVWNAALELGGMLVGEEVTITVDVQFIKA
jgi:polyisoprenoid-binding protein YceI